jgi:chromosome segregation ATPase
MGRPQIDYKKICKEQELEIKDLKSSLINSKMTMNYAQEKIEDLTDKKESWERQAIKFAGVIDYLEEKLEELKEHNEHS